MSFLHKHEVVHRYLFPKISDFGLAKINQTISQSMDAPSEKVIK